MGALLLCLASGGMLVVSPSLWGYGGPAWVNDRLCGVLIIVLVGLALWPASRALRWGIAAIGAWLLAAPWLLIYQAPAAILTDLAVGFACLLLPVAAGRDMADRGGGWGAVGRGWEVRGIEPHRAEPCPDV